MSRGFFITGTDTGCGKTAITLGLMCRLQQAGQIVLGMKPIASGAGMTPAGLRNDDAVSIQVQSSIRLPYEQVNPFAYAPPIAPHLAAQAAAEPIEIGRIAEIYGQLSKQADCVSVEGVGGWAVPLSETESLADLVRLLDLSVIMVVGLRLGCINHALMTEACIRISGCRLAGWVGNMIEPDMDALPGNIKTLNARIAAPCLGVVPCLDSTSPIVIAKYLDEALNMTD